MTDIRFINNKVIFDGHAKTKEECNLITSICNALNLSYEFDTVKYENGYAEFKLVEDAKELKFAPSGATLTINFDSNITKVAVTEQGLEWTSSGQTNNVSVSTTGGANNWTFTVTLADGYVIDTVTPGFSESFTMISNVTTTTFISNMGVGSEASMELTITSKLATAKQTIDISTLSGWSSLSEDSHVITVKARSRNYAESGLSNSITTHSVNGPPFNNITLSGQSVTSGAEVYYKLNDGPATLLCAAYESKSIILNNVTKLEVETTGQDISYIQVDNEIISYGGYTDVTSYLHHNASVHAYTDD